MAESEKIVLLEPPCNFTDPFVVFDSSIPKPSIARQWDSETENPNVKFESTKVDGFETPIVMLNQQVLSDQYIYSMTLDYKGFLPELELVIDDDKDDIQSIGGPGLRNYVAVVLCPNVDGIYRSISLPFYIKERKNLATNRIKYICEYYNVGLTDVKSMQIDKKPLTTYEFCEKIAKCLKIGFATTDKCKEINDPRWRQSYSQRIKDFITQQISIGGLDTNSIFDAWIDVYGHLVLENVSWVFDTTVKATNLSIVVQTNVEIPTKDIKDNKPFETQRTIAQLENYPINNLTIEKKYNNLSTEKTTDDGTDASFWILNSAGDMNVLEMQDIQMEENSLEGADNSMYKFKRSSFLGCEMSEDTPYMIQERIRKHWLEKKRAKYLICELMRPNYGLERGTLINVLISETDPKKIRMIGENFDNVVKENKVEAPYNLDANANVINLGDLTNTNVAIINPSLSGMYYIDGMRWVYNKDIKRVIQILYLIKKSKDNNLFSMVNSPIISPKQYEQIKVVTVNVDSK